MIKFFFCILCLMFCIGCETSKTIQGVTPPHVPDSSIDFQGTHGGIAYELIEMDAENFETIYIPSVIGQLRVKTVISECPPKSQQIKLLVKKSMDQSIGNSGKKEEFPPIEKVRGRFFIASKTNEDRTAVCFRSLGNMTSLTVNWLAEITELQKPKNISVVFYDDIAEVPFLSEVDLEKEKDAVRERISSTSVKEIYQTMFPEWHICEESPTVLRSLCDNSKVVPSSENVVSNR